MPAHVPVTGHLSGIKEARGQGAKIFTFWRALDRAATKRARPQTSIGGVETRMGKRGPRPLPTRLHIIHGNPGKRRLNKNEPQPETGIPELPAILNGEALLEWHRITAELLQLGLVTKVDRAALAAYCQAWGRWVEAEEHLKTEPIIFKSPSSYPVLSPWWVVANKAADQMHSFLTEFGLSPASRTRVHAMPPKEKPQGARKFLL